MIERQSLTDEAIARSLKNGFGINIDEINFLAMGADANASVFKVRAGEAFYFVKIKRGHSYDISVAILSFLQKMGIQEIIPPIKTVDGQVFTQVDGYSIVVYPYIEGQNGFSCPLTEDQWVSFGKALRQVHDLQVPTDVKAQIRHESYTSKWRDTLRSLYLNIDSQPAGDEWAQKLKEFMVVRSHTIHHLLEWSDQLSHKIQSATHDFVLCHSDIHGGNVLVGDSQSFYLADWDDAIMAPKERDLMFIGAGIGNVWNKPREQELFYKGYGKTDVNSTLIAYYRTERIVEDLALFGQDLLLTTEGGKNRHQAYEFITSMFESGGVVDIAFKTPEA